MPFDGTGFPGGGQGRRRSRGEDNLVTALILVVVLVLLVTPISLGALVDVVRALQGR